MDKLKEELERKRKLAQEAKGGNKYVSRGELEKRKLEELQEQQRREQEAKRRKKEEKLNGGEPKRKEEEEAPPVLEAFVSRISRADCIRELRARGEPVTLFGETDVDREKRLLHLREQAPDAELQKGQKNEFQQTLKEINSALAEGEAVVQRPDEHGVKKKKDTSWNPESFNKEPTCREETILFYLKRLLWEWEQELDQKPEAVKRSAAGISELATYVQTCKYIKPLLRELKKRLLEENLVKMLHQIVEFMKIREYVQANDVYLRLAIGNAPWPIGVTMVGIHERSAREKIFTNQVAHILNDERQRKYIQSVKRLITFAQSKYPTDPSKMVLN